MLEITCQKYHLCDRCYQEAYKQEKVGTNSKQMAPKWQRKKLKKNGLGRRIPKVRKMTQIYTIEEYVEFNIDENY